MVRLCSVSLSPIRRMRICLIYYTVSLLFYKCFLVGSSCMFWFLPLMFDFQGLFLCVYFRATTRPNFNMDGRALSLFICSRAITHTREGRLYDTRCSLKLQRSFTRLSRSTGIFLVARRFERFHFSASG